LEGTYEYLRGWAAANPERSPVLVLATDGQPSRLCFDDDDDLDGIEEITRVIAAAAAATLPIKTYVIGIGNIERLDEWALAGGTGKSAFIVNAADPKATETQFAAAMDEIREAEVPCEYPIPESTGTIDFTAVNVEFIESEGGSTLLTQVPSVTDCGQDLSWYYDDPASPTFVGLCPSACDRINSTGGAIEIVFGCMTVVR